MRKGVFGTYPTKEICLDFDAICPGNDDRDESHGKVMGEERAIVPGANRAKDR